MQFNNNNTFKKQRQRPKEPKKTERKEEKKSQTCPRGVSMPDFLGKNNDLCRFIEMIDQLSIFHDQTVYKELSGCQASTRLTNDIRFFYAT